MSQTMWIIILSYAASGLIFALLCRSITRQKGYASPAKYAVFGFFFNILAFIYAAGLPDLKAREALEQLAGKPAAAARPQQSGAEDPGVIAAITAAVSMIWNGSGQAAAAPVRAASAPAAASPSPAGFVIRQVRRV
jgi:hypothetical protein